MGLEEANDYFKKNFNSYLGFIFEEVAKQFLIEKYKANFGRQWGSYNEKENGKKLSKQYEIDLLSANNKTGELLAFEVKWKDLRFLDSKRILRELETKIQCLPLKLKKYKIKIGLIGKSVKSKEKLKKEGFVVFDLNDFFNLVKRKNDKK